MPCSSFTSLALADRVGVGADGAGGDDGGLDGVGVLLLGEVLVEEGGELARRRGEALLVGPRRRRVEELRRLIPAIIAIRSHSADWAKKIIISADTTRAAVAAAAVEAGADVVNDISGGLFDPAMIRTVARLEVPS